MSVEDVDQYLWGIEELERGTLEALRRRAILEIVPDPEQVVSSEVPFRVDSQIVAGFAAGAAAGRLLHRDRFVDVDGAADLEDWASLREFDRRIEAVADTIE